MFNSNFLLLVVADLIQSPELVKNAAFLIRSSESFSSLPTFAGTKTGTPPDESQE
jgi:hypothetical protein